MSPPSVIEANPRMRAGSLPHGDTRVPSDLLACEFVQALLEARRRPGSDVSDYASSTSAFDELLRQDGPKEKDDVTTLSVDDAYAAVSLAFRIAEHAGLLDALRSAAPVVTVQLPDERSLHAFDAVARVCFFGPAAHVLHVGSFGFAGEHSALRADGRNAVVLDCDVTSGLRNALEQGTSTALSLGVPVVAMSTDVWRQVPAPVRSLSDCTILPSKLDARALALVVEAVTGTRTDVPADDWISDVTLRHLRMCVSRHRGPASSLARLRSVVEGERRLDADLPDVRSLHGLDEARTLATAMVADFAAYREGRIGWSDMPRGMLLSGPPGTGKTFFVRCLAQTAGVPLVTGSLATWQSSGDGHLGDCLKAMRRSFSDARAASPSILFVDELDSIGDRRTFHPRSRDYATQIVNALLEELDGAGDRKGVVVLAATNHLAGIDPAILRSGRLDRVVHVDLPDASALVGILRTVLGDELRDVDLSPVASAGRGGSGADIARWVRDARGAARRDGRVVEVHDLLAAVRDGRPVMSADERRRVALHESGHACATLALGLGTVRDVSLHDMGGRTSIRPNAKTLTRSDAIGSIVQLLAGRAAERIFLGDRSAGGGGGPTSDLALATGIAIAVETSWGLGELGPLWVGDVGVLPAMHLPQVSRTVRDLLVRCEVEAERLVEASRASVVRCAERLLASGHLDEVEVREALSDVERFHVDSDVVHLRRGPPGD